MTKTSFALVNKRPVVEVILHGEVELTLDLLVDTGSDMVTVPEGLCQELGWEPLGERKIVVPGCSYAVPLFRGEIEFLGLRREVSVMGVSLPGLQNIDGLLGREFLDHFKVCFIEGERVTFERD